MASYWAAGRGRALVDIEALAAAASLRLGASQAAEKGVSKELAAFWVTTTYPKTGKLQLCTPKRAQQVRAQRQTHSDPGTAQPSVACFALLLELGIIPETVVILWAKEPLVVGQGGSAGAGAAEGGGGEGGGALASRAQQQHSPAIASAPPLPDWFGVADIPDTAVRRLYARESIRRHAEMAAAFAARAGATLVVDLESVTALLDGMTAINVVHAKPVDVMAELHRVQGAGTFVDTVYGVVMTDPRNAKGETVIRLLPTVATFEGGPVGVRLVDMCDGGLEAETLQNQLDVVSEALRERQTRAYKNVARSQVSIAVALGHMEIRDVDVGETAVSCWRRGGVRARTASAFQLPDGLPTWVWPLVDGALAANIERAEADYNYMKRTGICVRPPAPLPQSGLGVLMERRGNNLQPLAAAPLSPRQVGLVIADFEANPEPSYDECMKIGVRIHALVDDVVRHFKLLRMRVRQNKWTASKTASGTAGGAGAGADENTPPTGASAPRTDSDWLHVPFRKSCNYYACR
jgi:hypothetical protein